MARSSVRGKKNTNISINMHCQNNWHKNKTKRNEMKRIKTECKPPLVHNGNELTYGMHEKRDESSTPQ